MPALMLATPAQGRGPGGGMSRDGVHSVHPPHTHHHHQQYQGHPAPPPLHFSQPQHHPPYNQYTGPPQYNQHMGPPGDSRANYEQHQDFLAFEEQEELRRLQDLETLRHIISQWNANRLDLFELSMPNENLEFHGVMRFYYQAQDLASGQKVATKCIRVSSQATTKSIIETLIEKFRPDMKMLEMPEYALYEIHESGERRLGLDEKPLLVQLNWHKDDREGRFLLRRIDEASQMPATTQEDSSFKRKLSKREKKEQKKAEKKAAAGKGGEKDGINFGSGSTGGKNDETVAEKLYSELPDTSFTRSISNPEAVMRRRRQQKLEKKLQQFRSKDGGPDTGGTLKIYGDALCKDVPYKTLLLSITDTASMVVAEMLDKYGLNRNEAPAFSLVQATSIHNQHDMDGRGGGEYVLEDDECPLAILMNHQAQANRGAITFHVRRRMSHHGMDGRYAAKKKPSNPAAAQTAASHLPFLVELTTAGGPNGGGSAGPDSRIIRLKLTVTEVGSDVGGNGVQLPGLQRRHCVLAHTDGGIVTVTPVSPGADVSVNGQRIDQTTVLKHRCIVQFGGVSAWQLIDPLAMEQHMGDEMGSRGGLNSAPPGHQQFQHNQPQGKDSILPAVLEFREDTESAFFNALTVNLDPTIVNFKLAPTYTLYMATRFRASTHYRPELVPEERAVKLTDMLNRVADKILRMLATPPGANHAPTLSFWMGNSSELLHFLKSDRHITAFSLQAQDMLGDAVHMAFKQLVLVLQSELESVLPALLSDRDDDVESTTMGILNLFTSTMGLLRKCRVNAALTIQLFSQLFHFVNMWTFNLVVSDKNKGMYCTHKWGLRLKRRLARIEIWAEKQGLELAADCHLARIMQTAHLLQARKSTAEDIATLSSTCFKLNSVQLRYLLSHYHTADAEAPISTELIDTIVRVAENTVDELTRSEGRQVRLEEDFVLQLPFLLPEDNYSCDIIRGVPAGLFEFLAPLQNAGLCVMTPQPSSSGHWTIYMDNQNLSIVPRSPSELSMVDQTLGGGFMSNNNNNILQGSNRSIHRGYSPDQFPGNNQGGVNRPMLPAPPPVTADSRLSPPIPPPPGGDRYDRYNDQSSPEVQTIRLAKTNGMGLSIVAAKGMGQDRLGIYIKAVVEGGAAWQDGRLAAGDQLLAVDGHSLVGITQEHAAEIMMKTGNFVTLEVARQGAIFHGLATLLSQPSPVISNRGGGPAPPPPPSSSGGMRNHIPGSKSTPALHHHSSDYQNQEWLHQQFTGSSRHSTVDRTAHQPPQQLAGGSNFYQNLDSNNLVGKNLLLGGSQTSLTGLAPAGPGGRIARPASTHLIMSHSSSHQQLSRPQSTSVLSGPEKPSRQYSYEMDNSATQEEIITNEKPRVRFLEEPANERVVEEDSEQDDDDNGHDQEDQPQHDSGASRLDMLLHSQPSGPVAVSSPAKRVSFQQQHSSVQVQHQSDISSRATTTTTTESKLFASSQRQVSFREPSPQSFNNEEGTASGDDKEDTDNQTDVDTDTPAHQTTEREWDRDRGRTPEDRGGRIPEDPNAFITEAESLLNAASMGISQMEIKTSIGGSESSTMTTTSIMKHTPSVIGTQEVYRDPRQRRLMQAQEERKMSSTHIPDGSKLSFQEKMKLFAQEAGDAATPREKAKISRAQRDIETDT